MAKSYGIKPRGYRLPDETHIGKVRLQVANLDRSISYYETVIGMRVMNRTEASATLGPVDEDRSLIQLDERKDARAVSRRGLLGLYHFAILLPDRSSLGAFVQHLSAIGAYAGMSDHLVSEAVYLTDPDGLGIEVYADRDRSTWVAGNDQIEMATKPLDVQSLIEAAEGRQWKGVPSGTVIGHVHLYVGDIDKAADFYHTGMGLDKIVWSYPGALFMSAGGYHHHVGVNTWAQGAAPATDQDARLLDWELVLPDSAKAAEAASALEKAGYLVEREGDAVRARDPWGTAVRFHHHS
ncbi:MAG: VOC family protein [Gemmatimonadaceae bacterium]